MAERLLTIQDIAEGLSLGERTVYAMAASGELPAFKVRGQWRMRPDDFQAWMNDRASSGQAGVSERLPAYEVSSNAGSAVDEQQPIAELQHFTKRLSQAGMHERFVDALGSARVLSHSSFDRRPFELDLQAPLPQRVRVYIFNATRPPGGRPLGEHKVQLIVPGQGRGVRASFDHSDGRIVLLAGYAAEEDVFVLWDAGLYHEFAWSRNVQVKVETIIRASAGKVATQERRLRPSGSPSVTEVLVAARSDRLHLAILRRMELTRSRLVDE